MVFRGDGDPPVWLPSYALWSLLTARSILRSRLGMAMEGRNDGAEANLT
jgi:hypothetical protein